MTYAVYTTESFNKEFDKLSNFDKDKIKRIFVQLKDNPYVGDQIRYRFFREKRIIEKRVYFLVYDNLNAILIVAFGGKKAQQDTIDKIVQLLPEFKKYMEEILKKE